MMSEGKRTGKSTLTVEKPVLLKRFLFCFGWVCVCLKALAVTTALILEIEK